jgi:hypothetical protein
MLSIVSSTFDDPHHRLKFSMTLHVSIFTGQEMNFLKVSFIVTTNLKNKNEVMDFPIANNSLQTKKFAYGLTYKQPMPP